MQAAEIFSTSTLSGNVSGALFKLFYSAASPLSFQPLLQQAWSSNRGINYTPAAPAAATAFVLLIHSTSESRRPCFTRTPKLKCSTNAGIVTIKLSFTSMGGILQSLNDQFSNFFLYWTKHALRFTFYNFSHTGVATFCDHVILMLFPIFIYFLNL